MSSKVWELRKNLIAELGAFQMALFRTDTSDEEVDSLISAVRAEGYAAGANHIIDTRLATARSEGVAEGAEQERERIRKEATTCDLVVKESIGRDESGNEILSSHIEKVYAVFLSVLAPKEKP